MTCKQCGKGFPSDAALNGHIGAAHARKRELKPIEHSTAAGYRAHKRRNERACADCLRAWRASFRGKPKG